MRRLFGGGLVAALALLPAASLAAPPATLTVTVLGAGRQGDVRAMVFDNAPGFEGRTGPVAAFIRQPANGRAVFVVSELPPGHYAVAVFQDENGNGRLDTNRLGVPIEPVGFSNDAAGLFGPPDFAAASFTLETSDLALAIHLR